MQKNDILENKILSGYAAIYEAKPGAYAHRPKVEHIATGSEAVWRSHRPKRGAYRQRR